MKYTYQSSIQGRGESYYVHIHFDRHLFNGGHYRDLNNAPAHLQSTLDAIADTPGVIKGSKDAQATSGELIFIEGNELLVKINPLHNIPLTVSGIVKKIQGRYAKGERRHRVFKKTLDAVILERNKRTYGEA